MIIYVDFVGTIVEKESNGKTNIPRCNFGCFEVMLKLQQAGHTVYLNSSADDKLKPAITEYVNQKSWMLVRRNLRDTFEFKEEIKFHNYETKLYPVNWNLDYAIQETGTIFIDDDAPNIPLKSGFYNALSYVVDWEEVERQLIERMIILA